jgi:hypothetical protein
MIGQIKSESPFPARRRKEMMKIFKSMISKYQR